MTPFLIVGMLFLLLALAGLPLFGLMAALGWFLFSTADVDPAAMIVEIYRLGDFPALVAVPLFTFAGYVLAESKAPRRMVELAHALVGWMPGGLAVAAIASTAVFTAFSGASGVTIIALGGILFPALMEYGFDESFSLGLVTTSGSLGLLFPPSLPLILYSIVAKVDVDRLFASALMPGLLLVILLSAYSVYRGVRGNVRRVPFSRRQLGRALRTASWELPLPVIVVGGIYGGFFTASEAAAVTATYVLIVEVGIRKDLALGKDLPRIIRSSMILVGAIFVMLGGAAGLTNYLVDQQVPQAIFESARSVIENKYVFLAILNVILLGVTMVEVFSAIILIVPLIVPIAQQYGINPLHLGVTFLLNLEIGYMVTPIALNIFISSHRFGKPLPHVYRAVLPFLVILLCVLIAITYIPELSLGVTTAQAGP